MIEDSSDDEIEMEVLDLGPKPYSPPLPRLPKVTVKLHPRDVRALYGSSVEFEADFQVSDDRLLYVVWRVGSKEYERSSDEVDLYFEKGFSVIIIKELIFSMTGVVECELHWLEGNSSRLLAKARASCTVIHNTDVIDEFMRRSPSEFIGTSGGSLHRLPSRGLMTTGYLSTSGTIESSSNSLNAVSSEIGGSIRKIFCGLFSNQNEPVQVRASPIYAIHIALLWIPDRYFYECATFDRTNRSKTVKATFCFIKGIPHFLIKWNEASTDMGIYAVEKQESLYQFTEIERTTNCFFAIPAPASQLLLLRIRESEASSSFRSVQNLTWSEIKRLISNNITRVLPTVSDSSEPTTSYEEKQEEEDMSRYIIRKPTKYLPSLYRLLDNAIGFGGYAKVHIAYGFGSEVFAAKVMNTPTDRKRDRADEEFKILLRLRHPNIVRMLDGFSSIEMHVLIEEYLSGKSLGTILNQTMLKENEVIVILKQILHALKYIHGMSIVHCDIKPENLIMAHRNKLLIKIVDFGLAVDLISKPNYRGWAGTLGYMAPEILRRRPLSVAADMWSLGVVTYYMLSGKHPFDESSLIQLPYNIVKGNYNINYLAKLNVSPNAKGFVHSLLQSHTKNRMTASQALQSHWIMHGPSTPYDGHNRHPLPRIRGRLARARWMLVTNVIFFIYRLRAKSRRIIHELVVLHSAMIKN